MSLADETFSYIDIAFAKHLLQGAKDPILSNFLALLMKRSREGDLSLYAPNMQEITATVTMGPKSPIVCYNDHYYLRRNWDLETNVLLQIKRLSESSPKINLSIKAPPDLNEEQQKAFSLALSHPLLILSGGPGSGKTHFAKRLIESLLSQKPDLHIVALAPTGKAANRIRQKGVKTGTIHTALSIRDQKDLQKEAKPLVADLILVDECSMIDLTLWSYLLSAIESGTHVILIGDPFQLPPVDTSSIFFDLCKTHKLPHVQLTKIVRTDKKNLIDLALFIRDGKTDEALTLLKDESKTEVSLQPLPKLVPLIKDEESCILSPFTKGPFGTDECNKQMDEHLNSKRKPIVICKNDYHLGLMNGERGFLEDCKAHFTLDEEERIFKQAILPYYTLAYATTIHKSQGSEFEEVLLLLPEESDNLSRALIYTAVTRAKAKLTIYAQEKTLVEALTKTHPSTSNLTHRL